MLEYIGFPTREERICLSPIFILSCYITVETVYDVLLYNLLYTPRRMRSTYIRADTPLEEG